MKRAVKTPSRPATYGTATRLARIVYGLLGRPYGWSFDAIQDELRISERTLLRYAAACRRELHGGAKVRQRTVKSSWVGARSRDRLASSSRSADQPTRLAIAAKLFAIAAQ